MSDSACDRLMATMQTRLTRLLWLWVLGEVWCTRLVAGAVVVRL
jgi:hypothetical protein